MKIGQKEISDEKPAYIIAEIGMNHNGNLELAKEHIRQAQKTGVDAVKFQTFKAEHLLVRGDERFCAMRKYELKYEWHYELKSLAKSLNLDFISTPFGDSDVDFLEQLEVACFKTASCDLNNLPFLQKVAEKGKTILLSTGFSNQEEITLACQLLKQMDVQFVLLHCIAAYPTQIEDANLRTLDYFRAHYDCPIGLSDHSMDSIVIPAVARAKGACVFEKHFTIDRRLQGYDHAMSADPSALALMVQTIRTTEKTLGCVRSGVFESERARVARARRSLYWACSLPTGTLVKRENLKIVRPGLGLEPKYLDTILGRRIKVDVREDELVKIEQLQE